MKNLSYRLSCIKKDVYTFLFYFLRLSCSHSSHSLHHPSFGFQLTHPSVKSSTLPLTKMPFFRAFHIGKLISLYPAPSLLGLRNSSLTLRWRAQAFVSGKCPLFRALHFDIQFSLHPASSLFGIQQQFTHPPAKSSALSLRKITVF